MTQWLLRRAGAKYPTSQASAHAEAGRMAGWVGIGCNLLLSAGKLAAGFFSGSIAIMGDAVNNLSDAAASVITLIGFKLSAKPADKEHPFGHARFEYIAGLAVAVMVMVAGVELGRSGLDKILHPTPVDYGAASLAVLAASILLKLWMARFNRSLGRAIGSKTLEATYADSRNDVIATAALLAAALIARFLGLLLDGWMTLGVAVFILISGFSLVRDTLNPLLGEAPDPELVRHIQQKISGYPGVLGTHDLILHDYGPGRRFASAHVEMSSEADVIQSHDIIDNIERDFREQEDIHLIIHYDPVVTGVAAINTARTCTEEAVKEVDAALSIHDFRMVDGPSHVNYVFDVLAPAGYALSDEQLKQRIQAAVAAAACPSCEGPSGQAQPNKPVYTIITVDRSYAPIPT